jgi:hypothetical protein
VLRPAFSRLRTFMWFVTAVAGLTVRVDVLGVTSIVRALNLRPRLYTKLLVVAPKLVWDSFGSWLRTIRPGIPPSEFVVANALRQSLPDFLLGPAKNRFSNEIHRRSTGHAKYADFPLGWITKKWDS